MNPLPLNSVINGECISVMRGFPDKCFDMILTDMPYNTTACAWDKEVIPLDKLWEGFKRIIKDNGAIVMTASQPFTSKLVMSNLKMFKYEWVWEKHKSTNFFNANRQPMKIHENILVFYSKQPTYNAQKIYGELQTPRKSHNMIRDGVLGSPIPKIYSKKFEANKRNPVSIQKFSNHNQKENRFHPTQKPVALGQYLIKTYTNEGDTIFDGFAGSGSFLVAAMLEKRNYIGIELDETYCKIATERLKGVTVSMF